MSAVMLLDFLTTLITWQPRFWGSTAPYLSIICCVKQTSVVCGTPPPGAPAVPAGNGDCCHVIVVVNSQRPGFLVCAEATTVTVRKQQTIVIPSRTIDMIPPKMVRAMARTRTFTLRQPTNGGEG